MVRKVDDLIMSRPHVIADGGGGPTTGLDIIYNPIVADFPIAGETSVSVLVSVDEIDMSIDPVGYVVKYQLYALDNQTLEGTVSPEQIFYKNVNVTSVDCSGTTIVYTATGHPFNVGDYVTIQGSALLRFNVTSRRITAVSTNTFTIQRNSEGVTAGALNTSATAKHLIIIKNLGSGRKYDFFIQAFSPTPSLSANRGTVATYYNYITKILNKATQNKTSPIDPNKRTIGKSYLQITNDSRTKTSFQIAYKDFDLEIPSISQVSTSGLKKGSTTITKTINSFDTSYYAFGTSMMISNAEQGKEQSQIGRGGGGIGFFLSNSAETGYFVILDSGALAADLRENDLRVVKTNGKEMRVLADTQNSVLRNKAGKAISVKGDKTAGTLANIQGGQIYNIAVRVKVTPKQLQMIVDVNGFRVNVYDSVDYALKLPAIIPPSKGVGLFSTMGKVMFDYVYARKIEDTEFNKFTFEKDIYAGQFSNDYLDAAYGDLVYNQNFNQNDIDLVDKKPSAVEEFGTTAREIHKFSSRFEGPSKPSGFIAGTSKNISVLSIKMSNFNAEAYVMNNTSTSVPMESAFVYGNKVQRGEEQEYTTVNDTDFQYLEPITFSSSWIQTEEDAKLLGDWIKRSVINKGKVIEMEVFGNPLIAVSDIVSIKYVYQGILGTEKFIVTRVQHEFNEGLVTSLTCRTL